VSLINIPSISLLSAQSMVLIAVFRLPSLGLSVSDYSPPPLYRCRAEHNVPDNLCYPAILAFVWSVELHRGWFCHWLSDLPPGDNRNMTLIDSMVSHSPQFQGFRLVLLQSKAQTCPFIVTMPAMCGAQDMLLD
jgi:hypothetical protein